MIAECASNPWVDLLRDWAWGILIVALSFVWALEERWSKRGK